MNHVFAIFAEVAPKDGCELDNAQFAGAFVKCYVSATDEMNATRLLHDDLTNRRFRLVNIEWCVDHDSTEWENPNGVEQDHAVTRARETGDVVFGDFHAWRHRTDDVG